MKRICPRSLVVSDAERARRAVTVNVLVVDARMQVSELKAVSVKMKEMDEEVAMDVIWVFQSRKTVMKPQTMTTRLLPQCFTDSFLPLLCLLGRVRRGRGRQW